MTADVKSGADDAKGTNEIRVAKLAKPIWKRPTMVEINIHSDTLSSSTGPTDPLPSPEP